MKHLLHSFCRIAWESDPATNGTWSAYDDLGRCTAVTNARGQVIHNAYDHQGRMVWKQITTAGTPAKTITYTWDDYNIIAEQVTTDSAVTIYNIWGLDLSGSLQGAGGVGGLLAVIRDNETFTTAYDGNGNVTEYLSDSGTITAHYEYSPFGEIVIQSGPSSSTFIHRFSTKPWCGTTGLSEYELRKYSPSMGRWLNRDPVEEEGGLNLYVIVENRTIDDFDIFGERGRKSWYQRKLNKYPGKCSGLEGDALNLCLDGIAFFKSELAARQKGYEKCTPQTPRHDVPTSSIPIITRGFCKCCVIGIRYLTVNDTVFYSLAYAIVKIDPVRGKQVQ